MTTPEDSYRSGMDAFYHESGMIDKVRVLENKSDGDWIRYELEVLEVIKRSRIGEPSEVGERFDCDKRRDGSGLAGMWHLMDE
jgi:hypothetical protein